MPSPGESCRLSAGRQFTLPGFSEQLFIASQKYSDWCPENFNSLPQSSLNDRRHLLFHSRSKRRFSDPGPISNLTVSEEPTISHLHQMFPPNHDGMDYSENQMLSDGAKKDKLFASLLQELRVARDLNRQLCLELHKANMKLHLAQQQSSDHQPGSMAVLVRKLYETHSVRSEVLSNWSRTSDLCGRKSSFTSNKLESENVEDNLLREREILIKKLQSTEKKIQRIRNSQWHGPVTENSFFGQNTDRSLSSTSRCMGDVITFNKVPRSHSFAMTSPSTTGPPSLEDLDLTSKQNDGNYSTKSTSPHLLLQTNRPTFESRAYVPNNNVLIQNAASVAGPTLKRDIELQLATLERDRRQLEHQLQDSLGTRRLSEDRVVKLERLVSVLRKKLEMQTTISNSSSFNSSALPPSPTESKRSTNASYSVNPNDYASFSMSGRTSQLSAEGPNSLPSYLQVVGPITQL